MGGFWFPSYVVGAAFVTSNCFHTSSILVLGLFAWYMGGINLILV
jgi:hypothetical protein